MAEKKIGDIPIGIIFMLFMFGLFFNFVYEAEKSYNVADNISDDISDIYSTAENSYYDSEVQLETTTHNTSTFTVQSNTIVDTRGTGQANIISSKHPATIGQVINNLGTVLKTHYLITSLLASLVIIVGITLFVRFLRPGGA